MPPNITLESIKAEHTRLADLIAAFEQQQAPVALFFPEMTIDLAPGEHYAGLIVGKDGEPSHHLILMTDQPTDDLNWQAAQDWAKRIGGHIPTRREQALLYANLKEEFEPGAHWSCEAHESEFGWAWYQDFYDGYQSSLYRDDELRARAVRRLPI